jgi:diguanylate cyclase (GGDEF)-like protein/PAS domain S-box-containing protein
MQEAPSFRVLLIEDDPDDTLLIRRALAASTTMTWVVESVDRLSAGLDILSHGFFDVVLMDLGLPDAQGVDAIRYLRAHAPTVPVVVLTGLDDEEISTSALREGAQDYVVKDQANTASLSRALLYALERGRVERALRESEERFRTLVEGAEDIIYRTNHEGRFAYVNAAAVRIMGYAEEEVCGKLFIDLIRPDYRQRAAEFYARQAQERAPRSYFEFPAVAKDGTEVWIGQNVSPLPSGRGFQAVARDITDRKRLEAERDRLRTDLAQFFELSLEMLGTAGFDGCFKAVNKTWEQTLGFTPEELRTLPFVVLVHPEDRAAVAAEAQRLFDDLGPPTASFEARCRAKDGSERVLLWSLAVSRESKVYYVAARDITERKRREDALVRDASHDPLTGLPNRTQLQQRLARYLQRARHSGKRIAVLYVDLDGFKAINDSLGHAAGDEYLITLARRMEDCVRPGDLVARLGGDEFVILLDMVQDETSSMRAAERLQRSLQVPFRLGDREVKGAASIGVALSGPQHERPLDLLRDADAAMYRAKTAGKGHAVLWTA